jgi:DNA-binding PadR family transcriptional regulator
MHPYEIASALRAYGKDQDMEIKWGSLYTVVRNMERHGLIEPVESTRQGRRPERTVYRITGAGREELVDWTRELVSTPQRGANAFRAGLSVLSVLSPGEAAGLLRRRLELIESESAALREQLQGYAAEVPRLFLVEAEYDMALREAEAAWIRSLIGELDSGSFPDLTMWQTAHDTGEIPPELVELADRKIENPGHGAVTP